MTGQEAVAFTLGDRIKVSRETLSHLIMHLFRYGEEISSVDADMQSMSELTITLLAFVFYLSAGIVNAAQRVNDEF